jgi:hypothetical protein
MARPLGGFAVIVLIRRFGFRERTPAWLTSPHGPAIFPRFALATDAPRIEVPEEVRSLPARIAEQVG